MNDKERILMTLVRELESSAIQYGRSEGLVLYNEPSESYAHFAKYTDYRPGDLVICETGGIHNWTIGFVVERISETEALIRNIGSDDVCHITNESFTPIKGIHPMYLLDREEYKYYEKVIKAFRLGDEYWYRFGGLDIDGNIATIHVRGRYGMGIEPFTIQMRWNKQTSIKSILETMRQCGYGKPLSHTKEVEP